MFKNYTKLIAKQMDPSKEWVPVESIADNEHFRPLCLLKKKRKSSYIFHRAPYYQPTRFTLDDVLLPGKSIEPLLQDSSQVTLTKASNDQADGGLAFSIDLANVGMQGGASLSNVFSIKPQKRSVPLESLEALRRERKINTDHWFIKELQDTDMELYVVTEILEASEDAVYKESAKADGGITAKFWARLSAQGATEKTKSIVIPKGCTLAFRTTQIHIRDGAWDLGKLTIEEMRKIDFQGPSQGKLEEVVKELENHCRIFPDLSPHLRLIVFNTIKAVMRDKNLLQELSQKMEEVPKQNYGYELNTESPDLQALFSTLQHFPRYDLLLLAEGITYILNALHVLMEDQLLLLLKSLEKKIVPQQLKLVANILEHDLENQMQHFHVDARLLSFPHKKEQKLTIALVQLSGVHLQKDGSAVPGDQPFEAVAALFVALYALNLLSGAKMLKNHEQHFRETLILSLSIYI